MKKKTVRKIVQIAVSSEHDNVHSVLYALCDDGTLWFMSSAASEWTLEKNVPDTDNGYELAEHGY